MIISRASQLPLKTKLLGLKNIKANREGGYWHFALFLTILVLISMQDLHFLACNAILKWLRGCFIYILDSSNSSSFTF